MRMGVVHGLPNANNPQTIAIRNKNASAIIVNGAVVAFKLPGTGVYHGIDVTTYDESGSTKIFAGIFSAMLGKPNLGVDEVGEAVCYGFTDAIVAKRTRAASTDTWASCVAIATGEQLAPSTANQYLARVGSLAESNYELAQFIAAESAVSQTTNASDWTGVASGALAQTVRMKVFVRAM